MTFLSIKRSMTSVALATSLGAVLLLGATGPADAATTSAPTPAATAQASSSSQFLGIVGTPSLFKPVVSQAGTYVLRYRIEDFAFINTTVDGHDLGYIFQSAGTYDTKPITLSAGTHTIYSSAPESFLNVYASLVRVG